MAAPVVATVGTFEPGNDPTGTTQAMAKPSGVAVGDLMLCLWSVEHNGSGTLLAPPSGWSKAPDSDGSFQAVASGTAVYAWYRVADASDVSASTYNIPVQADRWRRGAIIRITGADPVNPFDGGDGAVAASSTSTPAVSVTTTGVDRLVLWHGGSYNLSAWSTMPTGFTELTAWVDASSTTSTVATRTLTSAGSAGEAVATGATMGKAAWVGAVKSATVAAPPPFDHRRRFRPLLVR